MHPSTLLASLVVSSIGYVAFAYGKRQRRLPPAIVGLVLMIFPYFVDSVAGMLSIAAALLFALWFVIKLGW
jgi:hypothetical protein